MNWNPLYNNLEFYKVLIGVPFTTSNTEHDIFTRNVLYKLPHKLPKYVSGNKKILANLNTALGHNLVSSLPWRNKLFGLALKKLAKTDMKDFWSSLD